MKLELELELSLALPEYCKLVPLAESPAETMELELELSLSLPNCQKMMGLDQKDGTDRKRGFHDACEKEDDEDKHGNSYNHMNSHHLNQRSTGQRVLEGCPPLGFSRRSGGCGRSSGGNNPRRERWVKVKMEGDPVGRKVDLSLHHSYRDLFHTLAKMFPNQRLDKRLRIGKRKGARWGRRGSCHQQAISYEDGKGDWKFVGDVTWGTFIRSAARLKIFAEYADS